MDGSSNEDFLYITGIVQFLTMIEDIPKSMVVGISNVDRKRDFTFPTSIEKDKKEFYTIGDSAKFISFFEDELVPLFKKTIKHLMTRLLIGQSLGGLLATEIVFTKPDLFT